MALTGGESSAGAANRWAGQGRAGQGSYGSSQTRLQARSAAGPGSLAGREELRKGCPIGWFCHGRSGPGRDESPGTWEELEALGQRNW